MGMNLEGHVLSEISRHKKTSTPWSHSYEVCKVVKFTETEQTVVSREGGKEKL